jgi:hypothetical protein
MHHDWLSNDEELIEVELSPAQWAEAITNMNTGTGTHCTIRYVGRERMPPCPEVSKRQELENEFANKMKAEAVKFAAAIGEAKELLQDKPNLNKADRAKILASMSKVQSLFSSTVPFACSQFQEVVEKTCHEAKAE